MSELDVWLEGQRVGRLVVDAGDWRFTYAPSWVDDPAAFPITPHLPLGERTYRDDGETRTVRWFFDNLLPEGGVRQALAQHARLAEADSFGLLEMFGRESAGALTLLPVDQPWAGGERYEPLSVEALRTLVLDLPRVPLLVAGGQARMSLAGAQHKLALHREYDRGWLLPQHAAASSLIVKPDNVRAADFPFCPANEHFCMTLAARLGLAVPSCELVRLPEPLFVVERFDRSVRDDGVVERRHQLDLCQLLDLWAGAKYESEGGPGLLVAFQALDQTRQPAVSRAQWLRWLIFNYAIGNSDAHAKNVSFLVDVRGIFLAPAYDLLSVAVYGADYDYMAMMIEGEVRYGWVEPRHWDALAISFGLAPAFLRRLRHALARVIVAPARELAGAELYQPDERALLADVVALIERHAGYLLVDA